VRDGRMERQLLEWIHSQENMNREVLKRQVVIKAREYSTDSGFKASRGWLNKFIRRNNLYHLLS
jgi:hypothetical protein